MKSPLLFRSRKDRTCRWRGEEGVVELESSSMPVRSSRMNWKESVYAALAAGASDPGRRSAAGGGSALRSSRESNWRLSLLLIAALVAGCHRWENVGGNWRVRHTEHLPEAGGSQPFLHRVQGVGRKPVLEFTYVYQYFGDDCLGFAARDGAFVACGDRAPLRLAVPNLMYFTFTPAGAVQESGNGLCPWSAVLASPVELKKVAMDQPPASGTYDFRSPLAVFDLTQKPLPPCPDEGRSTSTTSPLESPN